MKYFTKNRIAKLSIISTVIITISVLILMFRPHMGASIRTKFTKGKVKFCITGDTGMNTPIQKDVADIMKAEQCDRIIIVGDLIYPDGVNSSEDPQIKQKFDDYYFPLTLIGNKPQVALLSGNHDYSGNFNAWMKAVADRNWVLMPNRYFMEDVDGFCFYYLDSTILLRGTYLPELLPQILWLQQERQKNVKTCHTEIVLTHHPYLSEGRHGNAKDLLKWLYERLLINQSDFLISGHAHLAKDFGKIDKTQILVSGAGGDIEGKNNGGLLIVELDLKDRSLKYHFRKGTL